MDLDPPGMGSYSTLIVTMGLSGTVNPQCTPAADRRTDGRTDGRTDMLLAIAHLMLHALHAWHRWANKNAVLLSDSAVY